MHMVTGKFIGLIMVLAVLASGCITGESQEVKYGNKTTGDYILLTHTNENSGSFYIKQSSGNNPGGTFTETSESISLTYSDPAKWGFGDTIRKKGENEIITPKNEIWEKI